MWYQRSTERPTSTEFGTKNTKGYQHIESVVPNTVHVVPVEHWRLTGVQGDPLAQSVVPRVLRGTNPESVVPRNVHGVPVEHLSAERPTGIESVVPVVPMGTNT